ncbi:TIR domain-containing protein [Nocardia terpenica]|uniref:TIR domain-containing protein n=1 Tax=Nocardia terpenica TaxID=455432 RepID=A0A6G9Z701_9NOCA|nr:TIR domain-containing protein [Nocardia terpenica]QIS21379.1 TIR domain-containing protein [Nocardia terpenica]
MTATVRSRLRVRRLRAELGYGAFLSYSGDRDRQLLPRLQRAIEKQARPWYRAPRLRVFLDYSGIPIGPKLWAKIESGLSRSRWLVVAASPEARASKWVDREIEWWLDNKSADTILLVVTDGTLVWDEQTGDWDREQSTALPPRLMGTFDTEPVWKTVGWRQSDGIREADIDSTAVSIASIVRGMREDDLKSESLRDTKRNLRWAQAVALVLAALTVAAGIGLWQSIVARNRAEAATRQAISGRLVQDAEATLQGKQLGSDIHAMQEILAAHALSPSSATNTAIVDAMYDRRHLLSVAQIHGIGTTMGFGVAYNNGTLDIVSGVAFSPDGKRIVSGSFDKTLRLWDAATGKPIGTPLTGHTAGVNGVAFSPDGKRIVSGSDDGTLRLWDADSGQPIGTPLTGHTDSVNSVAFSPDGNRIISGSTDGTLRLWDTNSGQPIGAPLNGHTDTPLIGRTRDASRDMNKGVNTVAFSPDGKRIVSGGFDGTLRLWDTDSGQPIGVPLTGHTDSVTSVAFSPDGKRIVSGSNDQTVRLWDADSGQPIIRPFDAKTPGWTAGNNTGAVVDCVAFDPTGKWIVTGYSDGLLRLWNLTSGFPLSLPLAGDTDGVESVAFSPDGTRMVSGGRNGTIRIWDTTTIALTGHTNAVASVAFSPDSKRIVSGSSDRTVRLWDAATGQPIGAPLTGHTDWVRSVAFSPDGKRIVSGSADRTVRLWDADSGQSIGAPLTGHTDTVRGVAFSPDGRRIVSGSFDGTVRLWDADSGQPIGAPLTGHWAAVSSVAFSPDSKRIVSGSADSTVRLWDADSGHPIGAPLTGHTAAVTSVAFSPDGKRIVSGGDEGTLRLWDADSGQSIGAPLTGHTAAVSSVAFSPDGKRIVSGSSDSTVRLWDADSGRPVGAPLTGHPGLVSSVAFSPDGSHIASAANDFTIEVWPVFAPSIQDLCAKLPSNMSHKEWRDAVSPDIDYIQLCPGLPTSSDSNN